MKACFVALTLVVFPSLLYASDYEPRSPAELYWYFRNGQTNLAVSEAAYQVTATDLNSKTNFTYRSYQVGFLLDLGRFDQANSIIRHGESLYKKLNRGETLERWQRTSTSRLYYYHLKSRRYRKAKQTIEKLESQIRRSVSAPAGGGELKKLQAEKKRLLVLSRLRYSLAFEKADNKFPAPPAPPKLWTQFGYSLFPGGGHFYLGETGLGFLSLVTVSGFTAASILFAGSGDLPAAVVSGFFAFSFYQTSIVYALSLNQQKYRHEIQDWERQLILSSKYRF